jgi:hypothetical protein
MQKNDSGFKIPQNRRFLLIISMLGYIWDMKTPIINAAPPGDFFMPKKVMILMPFFRFFIV